MSQVKARRTGRWRRSTGALLIGSAVAILAVAPALAQREDQGLQLGCANDYFRLCAGTDPSSPEADRCMTRNRPRLSPECRNAIADYDRRTGARGGVRVQQ